MSDPTPFDVVRARFPATGEEDAGPLRDYADDLNLLRSQFDATDVQDVEMALTFDPLRAETHD